MVLGFTVLRFIVLSFMALGVTVLGFTVFGFVFLASRVSILKLVAVLQTTSVLLDSYPSPHFLRTILPCLHQTHVPPVCLGARFGYGVLILQASV